MIIHGFIFKGKLIESHLVSGWCGGRILFVNSSKSFNKGFGEKLDSGDFLEPAVRCLEESLEKYFEWEMKVLRPSQSDSRVDVCLYLLSPTGMAVYN